MASSPLERLDPADFYRQLDWIRDEWASSDEHAMAAKLVRLRRLLEHLPDRYWLEAEPLLERLGRSRVVNGLEHERTLRSLADLIGEWSRSRPPLLECPSCGISVRGRHGLEQHQELFDHHKLEQAAIA